MMQYTSLQLMIRPHILAKIQLHARDNTSCSLHQIDIKSNRFILFNIRGNSIWFELYNKSDMNCRMGYAKGVGCKGWKK